MGSHLHVRGRNEPKVAVHACVDAVKRFTRARRVLDNQLQIYVIYVNYVIYCNTNYDNRILSFTSTSITFRN